MGGDQGTDLDARGGELCHVAGICCEAAPEVSITAAAGAGILLGGICASGLRLRADLEKAGSECCTPSFFVWVVWVWRYSLDLCASHGLGDPLQTAGQKMARES